MFKYLSGLCGFRLAVINAFSLSAGRAGRELLRTHFLARAA
jgi:hypothetical protein